MRNQCKLHTKYNTVAVFGCVSIDLFAQTVECQYAPPKLRVSIQGVNQ